MQSLRDVSFLSKCDCLSIIVSRILLDMLQTCFFQSSVS
jgi:hypothetical protein